MYVKTGGIKMMNGKRGLSIILSTLVIVLIFFGCSNTNQDEAAEYGEDVSREEMSDSTNSYDAGFVESSADQSEPEFVQDDRSVEEEEHLHSDTLSEQMVIYNGNISIEVNDYDQAHNRIHEEVENVNGYIVESSVYQSEEQEQRVGTLVVKMPQDYFHPFLNELEATSANVLEKSTHGNDVTEEYVDLESRLRSKETVEERLLSFLDGAENTEDLLDISQDLSEVQEEIEQIKGRMNYLEDHVAYSTITIQLHEKRVNVASIQDQGSLNTTERAHSLFMDTINFLITIVSSIFIFIIGLSPVLVPLLILAAAALLYHKRNTRNKK